jgi:hypothetical protein
MAKKVYRVRGDSWKLAFQNSCFVGRPGLQMNYGCQLQGCARLSCAIVAGARQRGCEESKESMNATDYGTKAYGACKSSLRWEEPSGGGH